jgi:PAS domain S-box-containing protein
VVEGKDNFCSSKGKRRLRKQAKVYARDSEERFRSIIQAAGSVIILLDLEHHILEWNLAAERLYGWSRQEVLGQDYFEMFLPADVQELVAADHQKVLAGTPTRNFENFVFARDRSQKYVQWNAERLLDVNNQAVGVVLCGQDITLRKQAEEELSLHNQELLASKQSLEVQNEQHTAQLQCLFNLLPDYIFVVERQTMAIPFCNDIFAQGIGFENRQQVEGKTVFECFLAADAKYFAKQNEQVFSSKETLHVQETLVLQNQTYHFDTFKIPVKNQQGEVLSLLATSRDITELIETKQALSERSAQLETVNRELDSFSYSVSHDLRAPLRHISGFVGALRQRLEAAGTLDEKTKHYLDVIHKSSHKMAELIDGLLTLSRLGRKELACNSVDLAQLVTTAIRLVNTTTPRERKASQIEFQVRELPLLMGDEALLQQVFSNLIDNAVKFSRDRHLAKIEIGSLADGTIFVRDNGVGFPMEYADQLFGAFQRLHSQKDFEGSGIGLAIVQRIVHRHGGTIWADAKPDQGASFYFKLGQMLNDTQD